MTFLAPGDPVPWFAARSSNSPKFNFDTIGGRYVVLFFYGSAAHPPSGQALADFERYADQFDDENACFFGVSIDPDDERLNRVTPQLRGIRFFWDFDRNVSRLYGAAPPAERDESEDLASYRPFTIIVDPRLRTLAVFPLTDRPESHVARVMEFLGTLPKIGAPTMAQHQAPILIVPRVFEVEFCRTLIRVYEENGGYESGFMRDVNGKTVGMVDYNHKRRKDCEIADERLRQMAMARIHRRLVPEIEKAYQFRATRMERYIVACYEATTGGHFRAHRDNTTKGTAHRRFAVSLNLNTEEFEGGNLRFPEFGPQLYRPPSGGAVVFSCSLLHEATPVTRGVRYVFLPFVYDEPAARIREMNQQFLAGNTPAAPQPAETSNT